MRIRPLHDLRYERWMAAEDSQGAVQSLDFKVGKLSLNLFHQ